MYPQNTSTIAILFTIILLMVACDEGTKPIQESVPVITTTAISGITSTSALSGGNITSDGGASVTSRGVCWSTNSTPTIEDNITTDGSGTGSFTSTITGLDSNMTYNVRAYATNNAGTGYGGARPFFTSTANSQLEYLGQPPPGRELERFAPGIVPDWTHSNVTVSPDGKEIYWASYTTIFFTKLQNDVWTAPQVVSFSGQGTEYYYDDVPVVSPDNTKLFFLSKRPIGYPTQGSEHIWFVERIPTGWSEPQPLPQIVNALEEIHWQISIANNGTIYYSGGGSKIYFSRCENGVYTTPEKLSEIINSGDLTCPFIAPDESYIIFCKIVDHIGSLHISFKSNDGQWLLPQQLDQFSNYATSFVSRDGKYLFIHDHWISAELIEDLRPNNL